MCEQHNEQGVCGISTRKVYPSRQLPAGIVRSYHTFSPLPPPKTKAVIFCDTIYACFRYRLPGIGADSAG